MSGPPPGLRWGLAPLVAAAVALLGPGALKAQEALPPGPLLVEAGAGLLWEEGGGGGRRTGPALGLRVTLASLPVRPVLAATFARTELPATTGGRTERSWIFLVGGAEVPVVRGRVEVAVGLRVGAARRDDTLAGGLASSPHWTHLGEAGVVVRGGISGRWGWHASLAALRDDLLDTLFDPGETTGRTHATLTAGATLRLP